MEISTDWDNLVMWWIKDVPYVWKSTPGKHKNNGEWSDFYRIYLIDESNIQKISKIIAHIGSACDKEYAHISGYFNFSTKIRDIYLDKIRLNGEKKIVPKITNMKELYSFLNVKLNFDIEFISNFSKNIKKYSDLNCGLEMNKPYLISDLVCMNLSSSSVQSFMNNRKCTSVGFKISNNLIRVASSRIFSEPERAFIEPIVNSIDSYRELKNNQSGIGKFGMGFFSLLYFLENKNDEIEIKSVYEYSKDGVCAWICKIKKDVDGYTFIVTSKKVYQGTSPKTGVSIKLTSISSSLSRESLFFKADELLKRTFLLIKDVDIIINEKSIPRIGASTNDKIVVTIQFGTSRNKNTNIFECVDNAKGISLEILFSGLLVPSISTKSVEKFLQREIKSSKLTDVYHISYNSTPRLMIAVGDIIIHYESHIPDKDRQNKFNIYVLGLPSLTPLPISRDDVILSNPIFYNLAKEELFKLIDITIEKSNLYILELLLRNYAEYANDKNIYNLIEDGKKYIQNKKDIVFIPPGYYNFYERSVRPLTKIKNQYVESDYVNYELLSRHILEFNKGAIHIPSINRVAVIVKKLSEIYTSGGLTDIIFVSEIFVNENNLNEGWKNKLRLTFKLNIFENGIPKEYLSSYKYIEKNVMIDLLDEYNLSNDPKFKRKNLIIQLYNSEIFAQEYKCNKATDLISSYVKKFYDVVLSYYVDGITENKNMNHLLFTPIKYHDYNKYKNNNIDFINLFLYEILAISYVISNKDEEFLDRVFSIFYTFLLNLANRNIETSKIKFFFNHVSILYDDRSNPEFYRSAPMMDLYITSKKFYTLNTKEEKDNMINFIVFLQNASLESKNGFSLISNPYSGIFLWRKLYEVNRVFKDRNVYYVEVDDDIGEYFSHFLMDKNYVYWPFMNMTFHKILKNSSLNDILLKNKNLIERMIQYTYNELVIKYSYSSLKDIFKTFINSGFYNILDPVIDNLVYTAEIFLKISIKDVFKFNLVVLSDEGKKYKFNATELINYVYENEVDMENLDWLGNIKNFIPKHSAKFQSLEIAINEGTSKNYIDAVITELIQNSIDATRKFSSTFLKSPFVELRSGAIRKMGNYGISVEDFVGIPSNGIISLMIPFLSTKSEGSLLEENSSGEMGTGFMNVYRQPYTKKVIIQTKNPQDGLTYIIEATPVVKNKRTIDIIYEITINNSLTDRGTEISIIFNNEDDLKTSSLLSDVDLWCNRYLVHLSIGDSKIQYNKITTPKTEKIIYDSEVCTAYRIDRSKSSILLTNGIPFGELYPYIPKKGWEQCFGTGGLVINLKKNSYVPVQSRKKIIFNIDTNFNEILKKCIFYNIAENFMLPDDMGKKNYDIATNGGYIDGARWKSDPRQSIPDWNDANLFSVRLVRVELKDGMRHQLNYSTFSVTYFIRRIIEKIYNKKTYKNDSNITKDIVDENVEEIKTEIYKVITPGTKENADKYFFIPSIINMMYLWFSNKRILYDIGSTIKEIKLLELSDDFVYFVNDIIKQLWLIAKNLTKKDLLKGFNAVVSSDPPKVKFKKLEGASGVYNQKKHAIIFNPASIKNLSELEKDVKNFKKIKNNDDCCVFLKNGKNFKDFLQINLIPPNTLIHEFCHALRGEGHESNAHGNFLYEIRTSKKLDYVGVNRSFYTGARDIFLHLFADYRSPYIS